MTIYIKEQCEQRKFFQRCIFTYGGHKDLCFHNFSSIKMSGTMFGQIEVHTDKSIQDVENLLKENKVKFERISEF